MWATQRRTEADDGTTAAQEAEPANASKATAENDPSERSQARRARQM
jgi:hypothetical protein